MIELEHVGGARSVTGSKHVLRTSRATVLLECGLFQGHRADANARNRSLPIDAASLDAVILSHAHIDHSGALPMLVKNGYRGPIYATSATVDLCEPMLEDAAAIQQADAEHLRRLIARGHVDVAPAEPLYGRADVARTIAQMRTLAYHRPHEVAPGVRVTFLDAGHVLGSAIVVLDIDDDGKTVRFAYTGDVGRPHLPIVRDPEVPTDVSVLMMESTYGDRLHQPIERMGDDLERVVRRTFERGGKVIIPSFALERAQEVVYELALLQRAGRLPPMPVYIDSPLAVRLTDVFRRHPECYDEETAALFAAGRSPFDFPGLEYVASVEASKAIDTEGHPSIVIAGSGMCEGGRVLHHLRAHVDDPRSTVVIVGFQAEHTLGRRLVERRRDVRIFGVPRARAIDVAVLDGFSAHADQRGLVDFATAARDRGPLRKIVLVHGEAPAQATLAALLRERCNVEVVAPATADRTRVD